MQRIEHTLTIRGRDALGDQPRPDPVGFPLAATSNGWTIGDNDGVHYYVRQFKDMKASPDIAAATEDAMHRFATLCGWTLARAHARSGHAAATAGYLGSGTVFDEAIGDFAMVYADQNERDYAEFKLAIEEDRIPAHE